MNPASSSERLRQALARLSVPMQVVGWFIYITLPYLVLSLTQVLSRADALAIFSLKVINDLFSIGFFYTNLYVLTPYALRRQRASVLMLAFCGLLLLLYGVDWLYYRLYLHDMLLEMTRRLPQNAFMPMQPVWGVPLPIVLISTLSLLLLTSVSSGLAVFRDRAQYVAQSQQVVIQQQHAELTALKLQISPHFLFNTLNNLRWLARQKSDDTEEALLRLSDLMRYIIYQVDKGPVPLAKELTYLAHYIELQKLRLTDNNRVTFEVRADDRQVLIEPLLLLPFVENAFKHGLHTDDPSDITIRLTYRQGRLQFQTVNRMLKAQTPTADSGIGVQNVARRLALHYPDRHQLRIDQQAGLFFVDLTIDLPPPTSIAPAHDATLHRH